MKYFVPITPHEVNQAWEIIRYNVNNRTLYAQCTNKGIPIKNFSVFTEEDLENVLYNYDIIDSKPKDWLEKYQAKMNGIKNLHKDNQSND